VPTVDEVVRYVKDGPVARVTLNRPAKLNAMNLAMHERLAEVWDDFEADDDLVICVLTGAGERAFSTGQDLAELRRRYEDGEPPSSFGSRGRPGWPRLTERFELSKPVLGRINGLALGGGFELALACDIVVAVDSAEFALPEVRLGLVPGAGGIFRLARQLPQRLAMGYVLTGRRIPAATALSFGLVNEVVPKPELDRAVDAWAEDLLAASPAALRAAKEALSRSVDVPLPEAFRTRYFWEEQRLLSPDVQEGPRAFLERRPPRWRT
jgi:dehydration protein DpgD